ncbi:Exosome complex component CSL4 [Wickerhamomyces ciferrii]|uniref:Exosome complex component CSL4 n=1 Tax=Wickerhamomyces ciferrii (strain ATCC 14091 / BCRC 22168 / CBS 111 / JCM 3599 / NBRC 0793 / NRRL Y-1031 F-60-10) TaxID=1206466 RepID=K0KRA5_WICCF|nr:Exosome complex component CSL4 [Wickerhamomyces ciferrii]CCH45686.1 Exosome complex component CSL4 [Wickerhamomyces ciferrii]
MSIEIPSFTVPGQPLCPTLQKTKDPKLVHKFEPGNGAILQQVEINNKKTSIISSTLVGKVQIEEILEDEKETTDGQDEEESKNSQKEDNEEYNIKKFKISVIPNLKNQYNEFDFINKETTNTNFATNLPKEGDIVLSRVTKLNLKQAFVEILAVEGSGNVLTDSGIGSNGHGIIAPGGGSGAATFSIHQASSDLGETFKGIIRSQDVRSTDRDKVKIIESFKPGDIIRAQILSLGDGTNYYLTTSRNDLGVVYAKSYNGAGGLMYAIDWQTMVCSKTGELESRKCAKPF